MTVEITILSGARQGEQLWIDAERIVVGEAVDSDVRFASDGDAGARGRKAVLTASAEGWHIRNEGTGTWLVNQQLLSPNASCALRSGDIVRLSENGPDFQFSIIARRAASGGARPVGRSHAPQPITGDSEVRTSPTTRSHETRDAGPANALLESVRARPLLFAAAGVGVAAVVLALLFNLFKGGPSSPAGTAVARQAEQEGGTRGTPGNGASQVASETPSTPGRNSGGATAVAMSPGTDSLAPPVARPVEETPHSTRLAPSPIPPVTPAAELAVDLAAVAAKHQDAIVWFGVEGKSDRFPFCTGWAVKPDTVVSTGNWIAYLREMQDPAKGTRVFAYAERPTPRIIYVKTFRLHPKFDDRTQDSETSRHYNLGIAVLDGQVAAHCRYTTGPALRGQIEPNTPIIAAGFAIPVAQPLSPLNPQAPPTLVFKKGTVLMHDVFDKSIEFPRRILRIDSLGNLDGAPIFNASGDVVAVSTQVTAKSFGILAAGLADLVPP